MEKNENTLISGKCCCETFISDAQRDQRAKRIKKS